MTLILPKKACTVQHFDTNMPRSTIKRRGEPLYHICIVCWVKIKKKENLPWHLVIAAVFREHHKFILGQRDIV